MTGEIRGLALETSGRVGSVALSADGVTRACEQFPHGLAHAARIIPVMDSLCRARNWKPNDIHEIYVSIGPGSFTGLRVGITVAKTMATATGARLIAVPSVRVLAENAPPEAKHVVIVLDAKRGQIFTARFERDENGWTERESAHLDTLAEMIARSPRPLHLLGEGLPYHLQPPHEGVFLTGESMWQARAENVARLGWHMARSGHFVKPLELLPLYVRPPEAEEKFHSRAGGENP